MLQTLSLALLPILLIIAATSDVMTYRIPNWLTLLTALLFFPMAYATGLPLHDLGWHLAGGVLLFAIGFIMFQFGLLGGGDAKMMAAAGLWFGMGHIYSFLQGAAIAGFVQVLFMLGWSFLMLTTEISGGTGKMAGFWAKLRPMTPNVPFGFAIALGGIIAFRNTWWLQALQ